MTQPSATRLLAPHTARAKMVAKTNQVVMYSPVSNTQLQNYRVSLSHLQQVSLTRTRVSGGPCLQKKALARRALAVRTHLTEPTQRALKASRDAVDIPALGRGHRVSSLRAANCQEVHICDDSF